MRKINIQSQTVYLQDLRNPLGHLHMQRKYNLNCLMCYFCDLHSCFKGERGVFLGETESNINNSAQTRGVLAPRVLAVLLFRKREKKTALLLSFSVLKISSCITTSTLPWFMEMLQVVVGDMCGENVCSHSSFCICSLSKGTKLCPYILDYNLKQAYFDHLIVSYRMNTILHTYRLIS